MDPRVSNLQRLRDLLRERTLVRHIQDRLDASLCRKDTMKDFSGILFARVNAQPPLYGDALREWVMAQLDYYLDARRVLMESLTSEPFFSYARGQLAAAKKPGEMKERFFNAALARMRRAQPAPSGVDAWIDEQFQYFLNQELRLPSLFAEQTFCERLNLRLASSDGDQYSLRDFIRTVPARAWRDGSPGASGLEAWVFQQLDCSVSIRSELRRLLSGIGQADPVFLDRLKNKIGAALASSASWLPDRDNKILECLSDIVFSLFGDDLQYDPSRGNIEQWIMGRVPFQIRGFLAGMRGEVAGRPIEQEPIAPEPSPEPMSGTIYKALAKHCPEKEIDFALRVFRGDSYAQIARDLNERPNFEAIVANASKSQQEGKQVPLMALLAEVGIAPEPGVSHEGFAAGALIRLNALEELPGQNNAVMAARRLLVELGDKQVEARLRQQWWKWKQQMPELVKRLLADESLEGTIDEIDNLLHPQAEYHHEPPAGVDESFWDEDQAARDDEPDDPDEPENPAGSGIN